MIRWVDFLEQVHLGSFVALRAASWITILFVLLDSYRQEMFRLIGFLGGIALFLTLGILKVNGYVYFLICAILNIGTLFFLIIFRLLAKYLNGFWRIWSKRLQRWISTAFLCLGHYIELPEYEATLLVERLSTQSTTTILTTKKYNFLWGIVQMLICVGFTGVAPLLIIFIFFIYGEAIYYEYQFQKQDKEFKEKRQEVIARQSARMSLGLPCSESQGKKRKSSTYSPSTFISAYPLLQPAIVPKCHPAESRISVHTELPSRSSFEKPQNTTLTSDPHQITVTGISSVTEESRSYVQSEEDDPRSSLPRYKARKGEEIRITEGLIENEEL